MRMAKGLLGVSLVALLGGCATVSSEAVGVTVQTRPDGKAAIKPGLTYYLPRQLVKLTVVKSELEAKKLLEEQNKAAGEAETAKTARKKIEGDIAAIKDKMFTARDNASVSAILKEDLDKLNTALTAAKAAEDAAVAAAKVASAKVIAFRPSTADGKSKESVLTIELLPMAPDPAYAFRVDPKHSIFRDDQHKIALTPSGLLTSTDIVASDRTADILAEIATVAGYAAGGLGKDGTDLSVKQLDDKKAAEKKACETAPEKVVAIVDLADQAEIDRFNTDVLCLGIKIDPVDAASTFPKGLTKVEDAPTLPGLYYRPSVNASIRVSYCGEDVCFGEDGWFLKDTLNVPLPQFGAISPVPQRSGFMTRTAYKNTFKDGILVNYDADRPSELLEVARTPVRLVDGFFDGFSKIISLRTGANTDRVNLSASEIATFQSLAGDTEKLRLYQKCAAEKKAADEPLTPCLDLLD